MNNQQIVIKRIIKNAIILALYVVLTFVSYPISFSGFQFRLSEILILLCFFNRDYIIGISLGCFLVNFASPMMPWDLLIGTFATFLSCVAISFIKYLGIASLCPIIINAFLVGYEYYFILSQPFWLSVGEVALGETVMIIISYLVIMLTMKKEVMLNLIDAKQHRNFKW